MHSAQFLRFPRHLSCGGGHLTCPDLSYHHGLLPMVDTDLVRSAYGIVLFHNDLEMVCFLLRCGSFGIEGFRVNPNLRVVDFPIDELTISDDFEGLDEGLP